MASLLRLLHQRDTRVRSPPRPPRQPPQRQLRRPHPQLLPLPQDARGTATYLLQFWHQSRVCGLKINGRERSRLLGANLGTCWTQLIPSRLPEACSSYLPPGLVTPVLDAPCGAGNTPRTGRSCRLLRVLASPKTMPVTPSQTLRSHTRFGDTKVGRRGPHHNSAGRSSRR